MLRPHQTLEELAAHESHDALAVGVHDGDELIAVGFVVREGEPGHVGAGDDGEIGPVAHRPQERLAGYFCCATLPLHSERTRLHFV